MRNKEDSVIDEEVVNVLRRNLYGSRLLRMQLHGGMHMRARSIQGKKMKCRYPFAMVTLFASAIFLFFGAAAEAGVSIQYSSTLGWNSNSDGTTSLYSSVSVNADDVVVMSVSGNKKNTIALVQGGWSGGTNGVVTNLETSGDTYPASYISYIEIEQTGTYDFWMECGDPNYTAKSALYVLRSDGGDPITFIDSAEWVDNTTGPEIPLYVNIMLPILDINFDFSLLYVSLTFSIDKPSSFLV